MRLIPLVIAIGCALLLVGCADKEPPPRPEEQAAKLVADALSSGAGQGQDLPQVEVSEEGTTFDPPVQIDQLPDGVWFCDMGTVHYARKGKGDGRCPRCGMALSQRGEAATPEG
jgi:hypothetical protein